MQHKKGLAGSAASNGVGKCKHVNIAKLYIYSVTMQGKCWKILWL